MSGSSSRFRPAVGLTKWMRRKSAPVPVGGTLAADAPDFLLIERFLASVAACLRALGMPYDSAVAIFMQADRDDDDPQCGGGSSVPREPKNPPSFGPGRYSPPSSWFPAPQDRRGLIGSFLVVWETGACSLRLWDRSRRKEVRLVKSRLLTYLGDYGGAGTNDPEPPSVIATVPNAHGLPSEPHTTSGITATTHTNNERGFYDVSQEAA
jgi:hypothetical protein